MFQQYLSCLTQYWGNLEKSCHFVDRTCASQISRLVVQNLNFIICYTKSSPSNLQAGVPLLLQVCRYQNSQVLFGKLVRSARSGQTLFLLVLLCSYKRRLLLSYLGFTESELLSGALDQNSAGFCRFRCISCSAMALASSLIPISSSSCYLFLAPLIFPLFLLLRCYSPTYF